MPELSLHLAGGDLSQVKVLFGSEEFLITDYSGDYQKYSFYPNMTAPHFMEIAITRKKMAGRAWMRSASRVMTTRLSPSKISTMVALSPWAAIGLAGMKWKVEGGCGWTDGNWQHEGEASYDVFRDTDATNASISKGVLLDAGKYALKLYVAGDTFENHRRNRRCS